MPAFVKSSIVSFLKTYFRQTPPEYAERFLSLLPTPLRQCYEASLASTWITDEEDNLFVDAAVATLFPDRQDGRLLLGRMVAQSNLTGPYRLFLKIPSRAYVFKRMAGLWRTLNKAGTASVLNETNHSVTFQICGFPEMREYHHIFVQAYIQVILEATGVNQAHIDFHKDNPQAWQWTIRWD